MYLLDTNVISEMRKLKTPRMTPKVQRWLAKSDPAALHLSVITIFEMETGVLRLRSRDRFQAELLERWLRDHVLRAFKDRIIPVDTEIALRCAALHVPKTQPAYDSLIAATALVHRMTVVTRNVDDFAGTGVPVLNPWDA